MRNDEQEIYNRAKEALRGLDVGVDTACEKYADAVIALRGTGKLMDAVREYARARGQAPKQVSVPTAVQQMIERLDPAAESTRKLQIHLGKLAARFDCPVDALNPRELGRWLVGMDGAPSSKHNIRADVSRFFDWCRDEKGYLAQDADPLAGVPEFQKTRRTVRILRPADLVNLLTHVRPDFIAYIAVCALAGLHDKHARSLTWEQVDLENETLEVSGHKVPIRPSLKAWLGSCAGASGRLCPFANTAKQIGALCAEAHVRWRHNCLPHSFVAYMLAEGHTEMEVSNLTGIHATEVRNDFSGVATPEQARAWFNVFPAKDDQGRRIAVIR